MNHGFEQLGRIIDNILKQAGLEKGVKESQVITIWQDVVGEKISGYTQPIKVTDGKLFIKVSNPSWRNELLMLKPTIKEKLNKRIGSTVIKDIIFM